MVPAIKEDFVEPGQTNGSTPPVEILEACPRIGPNIHIGTFTYDVIAIEEALTQAKEPVDLEPGNHFILFQHGIDSFDPTIFKINLASKTLLDACDGQHTVLEIVTHLEDIFQTAKAQKDVIDSLNQLRAMDVIRI